MATELTGVVAEHIAAVNAFDTDAIVATFAPDAYVNDNRREIVGPRRDPAGSWTRRFVGDQRHHGGPRGRRPLRRHHRAGRATTAPTTRPTCPTS